MSSLSFRKANTFEKRALESSRIRVKYPDRVPVICRRSKSCKDLDELKKEKYLVPKEKTIGEFLHILRQKIKIHSDKAFFVMVEGRVLPGTSETFGNIYNDHKNDDGFLYIEYHGENTFGE